MTISAIKGQVDRMEAHGTNAVDRAIIKYSGAVTGALAGAAVSGSDGIERGWKIGKALGEATANSKKRADEKG